MRLHDLLEIFERHFLAFRWESINDVLGCDLARVVNVERLKDNLDPLFGQKILGVDRCGDKLRIVDLAITILIDLRDDFIDVFVRQSHVRFFDGLGKLRHFDDTRSVFIDKLKFLFEHDDLLRVDVLNKDTERHLFQLWLPIEFSEVL